MVLLLNLIPFVVIALAAASVIYFKTVKVAAIAATVVLLFAFLYPKIQPSYLPKGDIQRTTVPGFELSNAQIEDRNRKPVPSEVRQERQEQEYKKGAL